MLLPPIVYIQVTRSAEAGIDGLHATVQALTIVRAKCAGAIHLTIRGVPGRAWAQLLLEEESCVEWCPDSESSSPSSSLEPSSETLRPLLPSSFVPDGGPQALSPSAAAGMACMSCCWSRVSYQPELPSRPLQPSHPLRPSCRLPSCWLAALSACPTPCSMPVACGQAASTACPVSYSMPVRSWTRAPRRRR